MKIRLTGTHAQIGFALTAAGWAYTHLRVAALRRRLRTDALTGLANRLALEQAARKNTGDSAALFMLDLNEFKAINDTFGHRYGDQVLATVARRLRRLQGPRQLAVRLSGDEFAFWCGKPRSTGELDQLRQQLHAAVARPMTIDGYTITVTASIGSAVSAGPAAIEELLGRADADMYSDKRGTASGRPRRQKATA